MNLVVVGTGYVGLSVGLGFAKLGHRVACVDTDAGKLAQLDMGEAPFYEPGLAELLREMQETSRIVFTPDLSLFLPDAEIILLCVGTPPSPFGEPDLSAVFAAARTIGDTLTHEAVIAVKSTVPAQTTRRVLEIIRERMSVRGHVEAAAHVTAAMVPEFLREGQAIQDFFHPDRIVIGAEEASAFDKLSRLHEGIDAPILPMSIESAELAKLSSNAFLATKISFVNEMASVCERVGADVRDVAKAVGADHRIGDAFLQAGIGYGGSCFPKDVSALRHLAGEHGEEFRLLSAVIEVNNRARERFIRTVEHALGPLKGRPIAVWGLSFKPGTDDIRESAALDIVERFVARGADVSVYDPKAMEAAKKRLPDHVTFAPTAIDAARGAEALLVLTEWPEFRNVSFETLRLTMLDPRIFDGRNALADLNLGANGFTYRGVGLPT